MGMGDIVSLVEKAQATIETEEAEELQEKMAKETFDFQDYLDQIRRVRKMGSLKNMLEMMPGLAGQVNEDQVNEGELKREEAIILSMTKKERGNPLMIGPSRRSRIARGSGTSSAEVSRFLKKFEKTRTMMRKVAKNKKLQGQLMGGGR